MKIKPEDYFIFHVLSPEGVHAKANIKSSFAMQFNYGFRETPALLNQLGSWLTYEQGPYGFPLYLLTAPAQTQAQLLQLPKNFSTSSLATLDGVEATYLINKFSYVRFQVNNGFLIGYQVDYDVETETLFCHLLQCQFFSNDAHLMLNVPEHIQERLQTLIRFLLYVELTEPKIRYVAPGNKTGNILNNGINNKTIKGITIVDKNWNTKLISYNSSHVNGHWRHQPYGTGRRQYRMVWIAEHERKGFIRQAKTTSNT